MVASSSMLENGTGPEQVPRGLDVLWEVHEAVLGVDAPVHEPGRRPAGGGRRRLPHLQGERLRHGHPPPGRLRRWEWGFGQLSVDGSLSSQSQAVVMGGQGSYGGEKVGGKFKACVTAMPAGAM